VGVSSSSSSIGTSGALCAHVQAHAAAADEESRRKRTAERSRRLAEVQKQQAALEQAQASALQVGSCL
jgi:hypothetical protein